MSISRRRRCSSRGAAIPAVPLPPTGGREGDRVHRHQAAAANPPNQVDVLHKRKRPDTAAVIKQSACDQQTLIAVWQPERPATPRHPAFEAARAHVGAVQREVEIPSTRRVNHRCRGDRLPAIVKPCVGMQQKQPFAAGNSNTTGQLRAAPTRGDDHVRTCSSRDPQGIVCASTIGDDHLIGCGNRAQGGWQAVGRIECRDHYRKHAAVPGVAASLIGTHHHRLAGARATP